MSVVLGSSAAPGAVRGANGFRPRLAANWLQSRTRCESGSARVAHSPVALGTGRAAPPRLNARDPRVAAPP